MSNIISILYIYYNYIDTILMRSSYAKLKIFHKVMLRLQDKQYGIGLVILFIRRVLVLCKKEDFV
jgi:hypothetical protein